MCVCVCVLCFFALGYEGAEFNLGSAGDVCVLLSPSTCMR